MPTYAHMYIEQCTYLGFGLLQAPCEYILHGPILGHILTLSLSPFLGAHVRSPAFRRRLFIVLMTAAHISPNVFSLQMFLTNVQ
jgi:hypothetical protein